MPIYLWLKIAQLTNRSQTEILSGNTALPWWTRKTAPL